MGWMSGLSQMASLHGNVARPTGGFKQPQMPQMQQQYDPQAYQNLRRQQPQMQPQMPQMQQQYDPQAYQNLRRQQPQMPQMQPDKYNPNAAMSSAWQPQNQQSQMQTRPHQQMGGMWGYGLQQAAQQYNPSSQLTQNNLNAQFMPRWL